MKFHGECLNIHGQKLTQYISIPFNKIEKIENNKTVLSIDFFLGYLTLWKNVNHTHLIIYQSMIE